MAATVGVTEWRAAPLALDGAREFVVGDVHGQAGALEALLAAMAAAATAGSRLTLLGDLIDRGPDSLGALRLAARPAGELGFAAKTLLLGNHDILLLAVIEGTPEAATALAMWVDNGAAALLGQLGIAPDRAASPLSATVARLREGLGAEVLALLRGGQTHREVGNALLVHAGVDPAVPLRGWFARPRLWLADEDHCAWVRFPFLRHDGAFEGDRIIVHGHTPEPFIMRWKGLDPAQAHRLDGWRLGLDAGAGRVAGAELRDGAYRIYLAAA